MKKAVIVILVVLAVLAVLLPACQKTPDAFELITRQDFDWSAREEKPFIIESREYMLIDIHELAEEDLKTSTNRSVFYGKMTHITLCLSHQTRAG